MNDGHLDLLGLDAVRAGDATPDQRAHAERCADCRATIGRFRDLAARLAPAASGPGDPFAYVAVGRAILPWRGTARDPHLLAVASCLR